MSLNLLEAVPDKQPEIISYLPDNNFVQPPATAQLFIAIDLSCVQYAGSEDDILLERRVYRRLTPEYYACLCTRMEMASSKHSMSAINQAQTRLRNEWNVFALNEATDKRNASSWNPTLPAQFKYPDGACGTRE